MKSFQRVRFLVHFLEFGFRQKVVTIISYYLSADNCKKVGPQFRGAHVSKHVLSSS